LSVSIMGTGIAFVLLMGVRIFWRLQSMRIERVLWPERARTRAARGEALAPAMRTVLIGAGDAGVMAARELSKSVDHSRLIGFFDDDPLKRGQVIGGLKVLGASAEVPEWFSREAFDEAIITIGNRSGSKDVARIARLCENAGIPTRVIPPVADILSGKVSITNIRPVSIEDLLGREEVDLDTSLITGFLTGKRVMVTGAGGSIGSELVRQIARFEPEMIIMLDQCEYALFELDREAQSFAGSTKFVPVIADICDPERTRRVYDEHRPQAVFHSAAYKHVPLMEINAAEALDNNVLGTRSLAAQAGEFGVDVFVMISTDKAVNPTSVMGATKRLAEIMVQDLSGKYRGTRFESVRFGNVLGSTGSVVPLFKEQINRGGPVLVTHPDMTRYFMTIPEAAQLVLQAAAMGRGGEIFVLDMGEPVKIVDLARDLIRLSGFEPDEDIKIVFTGVRPGEKMFEELSTSAENVEKTRHPKIFIGRNHVPSTARIECVLASLPAIIREGDNDAIREALAGWLPEFQFHSALPGTR
jgi:FlaA1/EpsC-like NDP-sugar epimerase